MFRIFQGNSFGPYNITVRDKVTRLGVDLTGVTILYTLKSVSDDTTDDGEALLTGAITAHLDQSGDNKGKTTLPYLSETATANILPGKYNFDFKFVKVGEFVLNSFSIPFMVLAPNTRRMPA